MGARSDPGCSSFSLVGWVDNGEDSDHTVGPTAVEVLLVLGPGQRGATDSGFALVLLLSIQLLGSVGVDELSVWEIVHSDAVLGTDDEPVDLGGEEQDVDGRLGVNFVQVSTLDEVPDVDLTVSASGGNKHGVLGEVKAVNLGLVSNESVHQAHGLVIPDLDGSVPRGRHNDWGLDVVVESDAGNPVSMWVRVDSEFTNTVDVPDLDVLVDGAGDNLSVVWGESNSEDILGVTDEGSVGGALLQVPESDGTIPGGGEAESAIGGEVDIRDEVRVSLQDLSWDTPFLVVIGVRDVLLDVPDDEGTISGAGDQELSVLIGSDLLFSDLHAGNPTVMALEATSDAQVVLDELVFVLHSCLVKSVL